MAQSLTLSEQKNLDILEAASDLFKEHGFSDVSMDSIAERAGVSKRTVYNHFESKDALIEAIVDKMIQRFKDAARVDYDPATPLYEQLRTIANRQVEMEIDDETVSTARMLLAGMLTSPLVCKEALKEAKAKEDPLLTWVQDAVDDGRLEIESVETAVRLFRSLLESNFFWPSITEVHDVPQGVERELFLDSAVKMFLDFYAKAGRQQGAG